MTANNLHLVEVVHSPISSTNVDLKQQDITGHVHVGIYHHLAFKHSKTQHYVGSVAQESTGKIYTL